MNHLLRSTIAFLLLALVVRAQEPSFHVLERKGDAAPLPYAELLPPSFDPDVPYPHVILLGSTLADRDGVTGWFQQPWVETVRQRGHVFVAPMPASGTPFDQAVPRLLHHMLVTHSVEGMRFHLLVLDANEHVPRLMERAPRWFASVIHLANGVRPSTTDPPEFTTFATLDPDDPLAGLEPLRVRAHGPTGQLLETFHRAAARADEQHYFPCFAKDGVFLGTDPRERWTREEFQAWAMPYFQRESAWTFLPLRRHVVFAADERSAWFHELLWNETYGECRGSGTLVWEDEAWRIAQYDLTKPIPNDLMRSVCDLVDHAPAAPTVVYVVRHAEKLATPGERDPALSDVGEQRARELARVLERAGIDTFFATEYTRTRATLEPLARAMERTVTVHPARDPRGLAKLIREEFGGRRIAIAGHSNTVPAILRALGATGAPDLTEEDYDDLFVLTFAGSTASPVLLHLHYGLGD